MKTIKLKKNQDRRVREGYPWIFSNEIEGFGKEIIPGSVVRTEDFGGRFLGTGYFNPNSLIAVRILSRHEEKIDSGFFARRIARAVKLRKELYPGLESFRMVYGESDFLPGLVMDKYENSVCIKVMSRGIMLLLDEILRAIDLAAPAENIFYRMDEDIARQEGIAPGQGWLKGKNPGSITITENEAKFLVDIEKGQKTGFFFDQRENRQKLKNYVKGRTVLDCFAYTGSFSIFASKFGAESVTGIDSSSEAISAAPENALLNNANNCIFRKEDAFDYLQKKAAEKESFGLVLVDPPALIPSRKMFFQGVNKYVRLNGLALSCVEKDGFFITSSCSFHLGLNDFLKMLAEAASMSGRKLQVLELGMQARDHPVLPSMPETMYLKTAFCRIS